MPNIADRCTFIISDIQ